MFPPGNLSAATEEGVIPGAQQQKEGDGAPHVGRDHSAVRDTNAVMQFARDRQHENIPRQRNHQRYHEQTHTQTVQPKHLQFLWPSEPQPNSKVTYQNVHFPFVEMDSVVHENEANNVLQNNRMRHSSERIDSHGNTYIVRQPPDSYSIVRYNQNGNDAANQGSNNRNSVLSRTGSAASHDNRFSLRETTDKPNDQSNTLGGSKTKVSVKVEKVVVPEFVDLRDDVRLECHYNMSVFVLYSLKWYHNDKEIFRYLPSEPQPKLSLRAHGVVVDVSNK